MMATLILFPQARRIGKARHVAALWLNRSPRDREIYWRRIVDDQERILRRVGFSEAAVQSAIGDLAAAINHQIGLFEAGQSRRADMDNSSPNGAA